MSYLRMTLLAAALLLLAACGGEAEPVAQTPAATSAAGGETPEPTPTLVIQPTLPPPLLVQPQTPAGEATAPAGPLGPWPADRFGYGVQSHAVVGDPRVTMDVIANQLGMEWVKVQLEWPLVEPEAGFYQWFFYDGAVDEADRHGLRLMLSVVGAPAWTRAGGTENGPPDDYSVYAGFLTELLTRYAGKVHAIEVWNEQNLDREWATGRGIRAADYVEFLRLARQAIKARDPDVIVISGALAPTGVSDGVTALDDFVYLDQALAAGMLDYADCVGVHHNGYNIGPEVAFDQAPNDPQSATAFFRGPFDNSHHSWSFKTTVDTNAQKVQAVSPDMKLCVTEFGWASSEGYDAYPQGFEFALDNTLEEQAQFIVQAFQLMRDADDVWLAFLFNFDFGNKGDGPTDDTVPYSLVDLNGAPRPAFAAVAEMEKR